MRQFLTLLTFLLGLSLSVFAQTQSKLPPCPKPDYSKKTDWERYAKWSNCWGRYKIELDAKYSGDVLEGEWMNGHLHGQGSYTRTNGTKYIGDYKVGKKHGKGTWTTADGNKYVGDYKDGEWHGKGSQILVDGNKYEGDFKDGKWHGQGTLTRVNGDIYSGEFNEYEFHGMGTYSFASGIKYVGKFKDSKKHGQGTLTFDDGNKYVGEFKDDKYHGQGILIMPDGRTYEGIYENGNFVRAENVNLPFILQQPDLAIIEKRKKSDADRLATEIEGQRLREERNRQEQASASSKIESASDDLFLIKPQYHSLRTFREDVAAVLIGGPIAGKWGYIDKQGKLIIKPQFDVADSFYDGRARVRIGSEESGQWGFIDKQGKFVINPEFFIVNNFSEGLAAVTNSKFKWGFIDKQGNLVIKAKFERSSNFSDGLAAVAIEEGGTTKWGFIDKQGKFVIKPQFDIYVGDFSEGLAAVIIRVGKIDKSGFIDKQGNLVISAKFDNATKFSEGLAAVAIKEGETTKWGFIDKQGKFVINPEFSNVNDFSEGLAGVSLGGESGFINKQGQFVINPKYFCITCRFNEGIVAVRIGTGLSSKWGYIDKQGTWIINPQFKVASDFFDGFAEVNIGSDRYSSAWGILSSDMLKKIKTSELIKGSEQAKQSSKLSLQTTTTNPDVNGNVTITVRTNADTSSLKVNGEEQGGRPDGNYTIKKVARVGQDTQFTIVATDINGNTDSNTITVARQVVSQSSNQTASLKPESIKRAASRDAVAIIIGIQNYKRVPKAEFANSDAKEFYEYAIRGLGIKPENIKLLVDEEADDVNIVKAFENWLPLQVSKNKTDVYVFYSGHGLPSSDGKSLYFLPHGVDKELLTRTAVGQAEVVSALVASKPKSVTMFIDACYSGQTRGGETLLASAKPISLKADNNAFPSNFTVITASANDQISSSSPDLKHGIFSFYLMKGMEGDADGNKDGNITAGEMQEYLSDKVSRQAMSMSRKQDTQLVGDANKVLMGR